MPDDTRRKVRLDIIDSETNVPIEEVDPLTSADSVKFEDTGRYLPEELDYRLQYTNSEPVPTTIGGIPQGASFSAMPYNELFTNLLYADANMPEASLTWTGSDGLIIESGLTTSISVNVGYTKANRNIRTLKLYKMTGLISKEDFDINYAVLVNEFDVGDGSTETWSTNFVDNNAIIRDNTTFAAVVDDGFYSSISDVIQIKFVYNVYAGIINSSVVPDDTLISSITEYTAESISDIITTDEFSPSSQCFVVIVKKTMRLKRILDPNGFIITDSFDHTEDSNYNYYKSNPTTQTNFELKIIIESPS